MDRFERFVRTSVTDRSLCESIVKGYHAYLEASDSMHFGEEWERAKDKYAPKKPKDEVVAPADVKPDEQDDVELVDLNTLKDRDVAVASPTASKKPRVKARKTIGRGVAGSLKGRRDEIASYRKSMGKTMAAADEFLSRKPNMASPSDEKKSTEEVVGGAVASARKLGRKSPRDRGVLKLLNDKVGDRNAMDMIDRTSVKKDVAKGMDVNKFKKPGVAMGSERHGKADVGDIDA